MHIYPFFVSHHHSKMLFFDFFKFFLVFFKKGIANMEKVWYHI